MEKMTWTRPMAAVEQFMPNEYIAKCEDTTNEYYEFVCDAGVKNRYHDVYYEDNDQAGLQTGYYSGDYHRTSSFHPCGIEHYALKGSTTFIDGYLVMPNGDVEDVVIWTGEKDNNVHCTLALKSEIEVVKGNKS